MSRFLSARFAALEAYTPGEQPQDIEYVKLNTNESPFPPSPEVIAAVSAAEVGKLNLYPDPECKRLRRKLAALYGVGEENVFLSNGSDDILNFFFMAFCDAERPVAFPNISYGFYPVYAQLYNLPATVIPLREDFSLNVEDYCGLHQNIVIANPNAPTGMVIPVSDIEKIVQTYHVRENVDKYAYVASFDEIKENDFNLNIPRYVDTFEEEELVDIDQVKQNIADIEAELAQVQAQMAEYLKELGL